MTAADFPQVNTEFTAPDGLDEAQVKSIPGFAGVVERGSVEGLRLIVVAWKPTEAELERLNAGELIYLTVLGGLPPHFLSTSFAEATHIA